MDLTSLHLKLSDWFINQLMTLIDVLTLSQEEIVYQELLKEIFDTELIEYFNECRHTSIWRKKYSTLLPRELPNLNLHGDTYLKPAYREIYKFMNYLMNEKITPYQLSKKSFIDADYSCTVLRLWNNPKDCDYVKTTETFKLLVAMLDFYVSRQLSLPSSPPYFFLDTDWKILLPDEIESTRINLVDKEVIKAVVANDIVNKLPKDEIILTEDTVKTITKKHETIYPSDMNVKH